MKNRKFLLPSYGLMTLLILALTCASTTSALADSYQLSGKAKNRVEFHSKATLESFSGKARSIVAEFEVDPKNLPATKGKVTVDLRSLDTGLDLRNKHMRENHLHTDSFPNAVFELDSLVMSPGQASDGDAVTLFGAMTIHGVTHSVTTKGLVTGRSESAAAAPLRIETDFTLKITDYGIPRPEFLFLKLAEEVKIIVDLTLEPVIK